MAASEAVNDGFLTALRGLVSPKDLVEKSRRNLLIPVGLLVLITVVTIGFTLFVAAKKQDEIAISSSVNLATSILRKMEVDQGLLTLDYTWWDESIQNLIIEPDLSWASHNFGAYLSDNFGIATSVVLSGNNELIYASVDGTDALDFDLRKFGRGLEALLSQARLSDGKGQPTPKTGFLLLDGTVHLASASVISYDEAEQTIDNRAVVIMLKRVDADFLAKLAANYGLNGLRFHSPQTDATASLRLDGISGTKLTTLTWRPMLPGQDFLRSTAPLIVLLLLVVAGLSYLFAIIKLT